MEKKPTKKMKVTPTFDSERETRVLLEEVRSDFKLLAEQYGSMTSKLKEHDKNFSEVKGGLQMVKGGLQMVKGDLQMVKGDLQMVKGNLQMVKDQLGQLQNQVSSVLTNHEHRLNTLEAP